jgi:hypothetical protein
MFWSSNSIKSRLFDICKHSKNSDELITMFLQFASRLAHPKTAEEYRRIILQHENFNVEELWNQLYQAKHSSSHHRHNESQSLITAENMRKSLEMIKLMNNVLNRVYEMKNESFDIYKSEHILLLNELWNTLKPDRIREGFEETTNEVNMNVISSDWIEIGFQGNDPTTDFRGMGILGLTQLYYFARNRNQSSRLILSVFTQDKQRYYPFAIIGINITRFLLDLISETRMHRLLIENLGHSLIGNLDSYAILPSNDSTCLEFGINIIHDIYCIIFEEFYLQFVITNPDNIMSFNSIFDSVKASIRSKYEPV